jgi:hypothetical protein
VLAAERAPAVLGLLQLGERRLGKRLDARGRDGVSERLGDRMARPVADLEEPLARRPAATSDPLPAVIARELDA